MLEEKAKSSFLWIPLWRCEVGTWSYDLKLEMAERITSKVVSKHNDIILEAGTFCELVTKVYQIAEGPANENKGHLAEWV